MRYLAGLIIAVALVPVAASADKRTTEMSCGKDSLLSVDGNDGTYTIVGACKRVSINGNKNTVSVATTALLEINGNKNTVDARQADAIATNGNDNKVSYGNANARISNPGRGNKLTVGAGGGRAADRAEPEDKPSANGRAIDCARSPTFSITDGDGTYAFVGSCDKIAVMGGENKLTIESVKELVVTGAENTIDVESADKISAVGNDNTIRYKKGVSGAKPKIGSVGRHNKIEQVK